jgi:hypothetical protein
LVVDLVLEEERVVSKRCHVEGSVLVDVAVAVVGHSQLAHIGVVDDTRCNHNVEVVVLLIDVVVVVVDILHSNLNNHRHLLDQMAALLKPLLLLLHLRDLVKEQGNAIRNTLHIDQHMLPEIQLHGAGLVLLAMSPSPAI